METKSPENAGQKITPDIAAKIKSGQVVTLVIAENRLPSYSETALATGFKVEKIAGEGEEFPLLRGTPGEEKVVSQQVVRKGYIAVSIEKPEGSKKDTGPFWTALTRLERKQVLSPSKSTTEPIAKP